LNAVPGNSRIGLHERLLAAAAEGLEPNLRRWLTFLGEGWGELQFLEGPKRWEENQFAHFDSFEVALRLCEQAEQARPMGAYIIGNEIDPAVVTRAEPGRWHVVKGKKGGTSDNDIRRRRVLYFDGDVVRPRGTSSTDADLRVAHDAIDALLQRLEGLLGGRSALGVGHSGNGGCVMVALDHLPETDELQALIKGILAAVSLLHSTSRVKIDMAVSEPKRLMPAFGTTKRKGAAGVAERPHRRTSFLCAPKVERLDQAALEQLLHALRAELADEEQLAMVDKAMGKKAPAAVKPAPRPGRPAPRAENADSPFNLGNHVPVADVMTWLGLWEGDRPKCPGCGESDAGVALLDNNGLKCSHNRCATKGVRNGFRTPVDLVCEVKGCTPREAVEAMAAQFGFEDQVRAYWSKAPEAPAPESERRSKAKAQPAATKAAPVELELLLPFRTPADLPTFPIDALPPVIGRFVRALADELEVPADLPAVLSLSVLASALTGKFKVKVRRGWHEPLNLYTVVALEPGELKSPTFRRIFAPLYQHDRELREAWNELKEQIESGNAALPKGEAGEEVPAFPRLFADDATPEALARVLHEQREKIIIASDEGTIFGHMCGLYTKTPNNGIFLKGHDGGRFMVDRRIGAPLVLEEPKINFALAVQPEVIRSLALRPDLRGLGLWARFFYSFPSSRIGSRTFATPPADRFLEDAYRDAVLDLARRTPPDGKEPFLSLSGEAWELLREVLVSIDKSSGFGGKLRGIRDWASKLRGLIVRVAGLLHVAEHDQPLGAPVSAATVDRAVTIGRYALRHARHAFEQEMTLDSTESSAMLLLEAIQKRELRCFQAPSFSQRDVQQAVWSLRKADLAGGALRQLVDRGYLRLEQDGRKVRYLPIERPPPTARAQAPAAEDVAC